MTAPAPVKHRWTVPPASLADLAARAGVQLPPAFARAAAPGPEVVADPAAQAVLVSLDAVDPATGSAVPPLAEALASLRAPLLTVSVRVGAARAGISGVVSYEAALTLGRQALLVLLHRDGIDLVEVSAVPTDALPTELHRLLDLLPAGPVVGSPAPPRADLVVPFAALALVQDLLDGRSALSPAELEVVAGETGAAPAALSALAALVGSTRSVLQVVVAAPSARTGEPGLDQLLWYETADGWTAVEPAPDGGAARPVRLRGVDVASVVPALAPLLVGALG